MKQKTLCALTQALLYLLMGFVAFCLLMAYLDAGWRDVFAGYYGFEGGIVFFYAFVTASALLALWVLFELAGVMRTVEKDPFIRRNVRAFARLGLASELAGALFVIKCTVQFTPMTVVCAVVMLLAGLFSLVLTRVFEKAVLYKCDNDLTI